MVVSNIFFFESLPGEMIQFDSYSTNGLKPPTSICEACIADALNVSGLVAYIFKVKHGRLNGLVTIPYMEYLGLYGKI